MVRIFPYTILDAEVTNFGEIGKQAKLSCLEGDKYPNDGLEVFWKINGELAETTSKEKDLTIEKTGLI